MTSLDSTYAKPFLTVPAQIRRLRDRGMDCETDAFATAILERYGYYRLSGYWHPYRELPAPPAPRVDADGREIRLDTFVPDTSLAHVVALYDFDQALRTRLSQPPPTTTGSKNTTVTKRVPEMPSSSTSERNTVPTYRSGWQQRSCRSVY